MQAIVKALVAEAEGKRNAAAAGGRLRAGGHAVTIDMSTLFSFGAGGSAGTTYTARSSHPALVTADTTDRRLVLTPVAPARVTVTAARVGDSAEVAFTVEVEAAPSEVPAAPPLAQLLLALLLLGGGAYYRVRQAHHWAR